MGAVEDTIAELEAELATVNEAISAYIGGIEEMSSGNQRFRRASYRDMVLRKDELRREISRLKGRVAGVARFGRSPNV